MDADCHAPGECAANLRERPAGGLHIDNDSANSAATIANSILWGNEGEAPDVLDKQITYIGEPPLVFHSIVEDGDPADLRHF